ncbi:uncharacterized protein ASCRUDRAFT_71747 [Ascoidea rubescens DSM 1968]|uniref:Mitochondrial outer membrane transport complex Sam37/metaxin N-terminal domain-containing protein n=1 Tax=Ascoidea rubescens DSM 1968 TaxID=1344418 RepID=A0A1D2VCZ3_9ASCO|nr:hypothetical protein ASCRUDRAFT_71747 [Ascoidea rubescens DSM 1968]ODV59390.1 hypothetical protein ASCRUDRAFT_71747 [Ascoidea rubescens DSM 1968]
MFELYVWGSNGQVSKISPECLATCIYLKLSIKDSNKFTVITSKDTSYFKLIDYVLPFLIDTTNNNKVIEGYHNIIKYIKKININYDLDDWLIEDEFSNYQKNENNENNENNKINKNNENLLNNHKGTNSSISDELLNFGLISIINDSLKVINYYYYYINDENYNNYTCSVFKDGLSFPLNFYLPSSYKKIAEDSTIIIDLSNDKKNKVEVELDKRLEEELNLPKLSSLHSDLYEKNLTKLKLLKKTKINLRCLNLIENFLQDIDIYESYHNFDNNTQKSNFLFGNQITSSDIYLISNIISLNNKDLPDNFIHSYLNLKYPKLIQLAESFDKIHI